MNEAVLERARAGDGEAFRQLAALYESELRVHCYRILGSFTEAEDAVQESLLAAWRGLDGFEGRSSLRAWLYRIATNRCLNLRRDTGRRRPPEPTPSFDPPEPTRRGEVTWLQPYPDALLEQILDRDPSTCKSDNRFRRRLQPYPDALLEQILDRDPGPAARYTAKEAVELTFVAALQHLPPRQTAAVVLRDVLGYSTAEVADLLDTSTTVVKGILQRARAGLRQHRDAIAGHQVPLPDSPREREVSRRFAETFTAGDIDGLVGLLTDDAWLAMPPAPHQYHGKAAIRAFLASFNAWQAERRFRLLPTRANTRPAFGCYLTEPGRSTAHPAGILVLDPREDQLHAVTWFLHDAIQHFELPELIDVDVGDSRSDFVRQQP